jgi:DNA-binding NtrC family response regulator
MPNILIAAHTRGVAANLAESLGAVGHAARIFEAASATDLAEQLPARVRAEAPALLVLELKQSADALAALRRSHPSLPVVALLSAARPEVAFVAARLGAAQMLLLSQPDDEVVAVIVRELTTSSYVSRSAPAAANDTQKPVVRPTMRREKTVTRATRKPSKLVAKASPSEGIFSISKRASLAAEAVEIRRTLEQTRWNRKRAATLLQMSYKSLLNRLKVLETSDLLG